MNKSALIRAVLLLFLASALPCKAGAAAASAPRQVAGTAFERHIVKDQLGRDVTYYLSRPTNGPAPLMLMIQGSGCDPVFVEQPGGGILINLFNLDTYAREGKFTVIAVEKPLTAPQRHENRGRAHACPTAFNEDFTPERWLVALQAGLADARKRPWVDQKRTLVFGFSEGAAMAAMLAAKDPRITDVITTGGSGTSQLYDFIVGAYRNCFDVPACLADVEHKTRAINATPDSATEFVWGHPHKHLLQGRSGRTTFAQQGARVRRLRDRRQVHPRPVAGDHGGEAAWCGPRRHGAQGAERQPRSDARRREYAGRSRQGVPWGLGVVLASQIEGK